jgi:hypothetical protein
MTDVQTRLLKALLVSCAIELPMCLLLFVPRNPSMAVLTWHGFAYFVVAALTDWLRISTPVFAIGVFVFQTALLTPFLYVVMRVAPWVSRKWSKLTDDLLK